MKQYKNYHYRQIIKEWVGQETTKPMEPVLLPEETLYKQGEQWYKLIKEVKEHSPSTISFETRIYNRDYHDHEPTTKTLIRMAEPLTIEQAKWYKANVQINQAMVDRHARLMEEWKVANPGNCLKALGYAPQVIDGRLYFCGPDPDGYGEWKKAVTEDEAMEMVMAVLKCFPSKDHRRLIG
jgi:hypothetical protein